MSPAAHPGRGAQRGLLGAVEQRLEVLGRLAVGADELEAREPLVVAVGDSARGPAVSRRRRAERLVEAGDRIEPEHPPRDQHVELDLKRARGR